MPFLGWYKQSEVDGFVDYAVKEAIKQCNAANKSQVHIPSLKTYADSISSLEAMYKFNYITDTRINKSIREYAHQCSELCREIHDFYEKQYYALAERYEQLLSVGEVLKELKEIKELLSK